jgi:hypothetical protein
MQKWEYSVLRFGSIGTREEPRLLATISTREGHEEFQGKPDLSFRIEMLDKMGAQAWELVGFQEGMHIFKRPISN